MTHDVQVNLFAFNEKLNEFRASGRYCDVDIRVENRSFKCHRLALATASEYFDTMFSGHFRESRTDTITLNGVDAHTFEEVLRFAYTGDVAVSRENAFSLLRASEFFKLDGVEKLCTRFIEQNLPIPEIFGALVYATLTKRTSMVRAISRHVMKHFDEFSDDPQFLELPYENVCVLLNQRWHLSPKNEGALVSALLQWVNQATDSRKKYVDELFEKVRVRNMSEDYVKAMLKKFMFKTSIATEPRSPTEYERLPIRPALGLHVYMSNVDEEITKVYSTNKSSPHWSPSYSMDHQFDIYDLACVGVDNYLYYLDRPVESFRACLSLDVSPDCSDSYPLKYPPVELDFQYVSMCDIRNNIYIHGASRRRSMAAAASSSFSDDEISQCIFAYNVDVDSWFAVPLLRKRFIRSTMTAFNNVLYYVAGRKVLPAAAHATPEAVSISIQCLDLRTSAWQDVTNNASKVWENESVRNIYLCSVVDGKIYVCPDNPDCLNRVDVASYDLTAKKWVEVERLNEGYFIPHQLLQYENLLWTFGYSATKLKYNVQTYNASINEWSSSAVCGMLGSIHDDEEPQEEDFLRAVVFKS